MHPPVRFKNDPWAGSCSLELVPWPPDHLPRVESSGSQVDSLNSSPGGASFAAVR